MTCGGGDGEVRIRAEWDAKPSDDYGSCEGRNYSVDATFQAEGWNSISDSDSPRWQCLDIPGGDYRILMYSIGQTPCLAAAMTTSGSSSVGMDSFAGAMVAIAAVGFVMAGYDCYYDLFVVFGGAV